MKSKSNNATWRRGRLLHAATDDHVPPLAKMMKSEKLLPFWNALKTILSDGLGVASAIYSGGDNRFQGRRLVFANYRLGSELGC